MKIFKILFEVIIVIIILFLVLVAAAIFLAKFKHTTLVGKMIESQIIKYPQIVTIANLDQPGEARYSFVKGNDLIKVKVYYSDSFVPDKDLRIWVKNMVEDTVDRGVDVEVQASDIVVKNAYSTSDLNSLRKSLVPRFNFGPTLYIIYLSTYGDKPSNVGIVLHKDTIFIFKKSLETLTESVNVLKQLEQSTLMHEWGHILGLEHQSRDDCVMSERIEVYDSPLGHNIATEYCGETLSELKMIKRKLQ